MSDRHPATTGIFQESIMIDIRQFKFASCALVICMLAACGGGASAPPSSSPSPSGSGSGTNNSSNSNWVGTKEVGGAGYVFTQADAVATDANGNVYVAGYTTASLLGNTFSGTEDMFLTKYDAGGNVVFAKQVVPTISSGYPGNTFARAKSVATDANGNIYVVGFVSATNGPASFYDQTLTYNLYYYAFLTKYDSNGNVVYTRLIGSPDDLGSSNSSSTIGTGVAIDSAGNAIVVGYTDHELYHDSTGFVLTYQLGPNDMFIARYDGNGNQLSLNTYGTTTVATYATSVATDSNDNIFVAGWINGGAMFSVGATTCTHNQVGNVDGFILKFDKNGARQFSMSFPDWMTNYPLMTWVRTECTGPASSDHAVQFGTAGAYTYLHGISVDTNGTVYVAGNTGTQVGDSLSYSLAKPSGAYSAFVARYDNNLSTQLSFKQINGSNGVSAQGVAADHSGNTYVTGYTYSSLDGSRVLPYGGSDLFLSKYDTNGNEIYLRELGGTALRSTAVGQAVAVDSSGNAFVTGWTLGGLDGNNGISSYNDYFVTKYSKDGVKQ
jgi:hypothetical protein